MITVSMGLRRERSIVQQDLLSGLVVCLTSCFVSSLAYPVSRLVLSNLVLS